MKRLVLAAGLILTAAAPANAQPSDPYTLMLSADADDDGKVSRQELIDSRGDMFLKLDRNGDGVLSDADRRKSRPRLASIETVRIDQLKKDFDADGDGKVTRDEFVNGPTPLFDKADANADGFVTKDEAKAARSGD